MNISEIRENVVLAQFDNRYMLASTMMRVAEFYESPLAGITGQYFTIEQFMDKYAASTPPFSYRCDDYLYRGKQNFTYTIEWEGFNIPGDTVRKFLQIFEPHGLLEKEKHLFSILQKWIRSQQQFYLIAAEDEAVNHEVAHAYYYLHPEYKQEMDALIRKFSRKDKMCKCILSSGYNEAVLNDEIQAYLGTGTPKDINEDVGFKATRSEIAPFRKAFQQAEKRWKW